MLGLATLEHQQQLKHLTTVNLADLVGTQIVHLTNKAIQRQVQILFTESTPIQVHAEAFLLGQAIYNVLENALDFSPDNATISISIRQLENNAVIQIKTKARAFQTMQ